ncbi:MAG: hypothetical protein CCU26_11665 [Nitrospira sp. UW-LDO-01]|nr:MAG: hypothetical protein CCU26_11665 [Nitrospira sp. UW-LDO-01]
MYLLASSLAAALLDGLFEHFEVQSATVSSLIVQRCAKRNRVFQQTAMLGSWNWLSDGVV